MVRRDGLRKDGDCTSVSVDARIAISAYDIWSLGEMIKVYAVMYTGGLSCLLEIVYSF
jgi:hypothetical protein